MRLLSRSCLLLLAAGLCTSASATNVYQWKDAKGVLHSSDKPPPGQKYDPGVVSGDEALDLWRTPPMFTVAAAP